MDAGGSLKGDEHSHVRKPFLPERSGSAPSASSR